MPSGIRHAIARVNWEAKGAKLLGAVCLFTLGGMFAAGFWPFHSPRNQVTWVVDGNGLHLGRYATLLSSGAFKTVSPNAGTSCSIEVWVNPDKTQTSATLFAFYVPDNPRQISLFQSNRYLGLQTDLQEARGNGKNTIYAGPVFRRGRLVLITITSAGGMTSIYFDGSLARQSSQVSLSARDFKGRLIIANSPIADDSWSGYLRGIAFYDQELAPAEVVRHYENWKKDGRPDIAGAGRALALYLLDEREGRIIHDRGSAATDLYIPETYQLVDQPFLEPFWKEFSPTWGYCEDVFVNITGFMPFGFLVCAFLGLGRRIKRPALVTILLGFAVSLTIECLQALLPTRDSGTTDLITNTLGTCFGVVCYRLRFWRGILTRSWKKFAGIPAEEPLTPQLN